MSKSQSLFSEVYFVGASFGAVFNRDHVYDCLESVSSHSLQPVHPKHPATSKQQKGQALWTWANPLTKFVRGKRSVNTIDFLVVTSYL